MEEIINYSKYTIEELIDCLYHIDSEKYQKEYNLLEDEIRKRMNWDDSISLDSDFAKEKFYEIVNKEDELSKKEKIKKGQIIQRIQVLSLAPVVTIIILALMKVPVNDKYMPLLVLTFGLYSIGEFVKSIFTGEIRIKARKLNKKERPILFFITQITNAVFGLTLSLLSLYKLISQIK